PNRLVTALTAASFRPVTVWSTDTTTWSVVGSTAQAVPGILVDSASAAVTVASCAAPYRTSRGVAPATRTCSAAALSVTVTTGAPVRSRYDPADRPPSWLANALAAAGVAVCAAGVACAGGATSSGPATRPAAAALAAAGRSGEGRAAAAG